VQDELSSGRRNEVVDLRLLDEEAAVAVVKGETALAVCHRSPSLVDRGHSRNILLSDSSGGMSVWCCCSRGARRAAAFFFQIQAAA